MPPCFAAGRTCALIVNSFNLISENFYLFFKAQVPIRTLTLLHTCARVGSEAEGQSHIFQEGSLKPKLSSTPKPQISLHIP
jgi:hypothetical protein